MDLNKWINNWDSSVRNTHELSRLFDWKVVDWIDKYGNDIVKGM